MEKPSPNLQVALSMLAAIVLLDGLAVGITVALNVAGGPFVVVSMSLALIFLLLLRWRHKAGYAGAIVVGIYEIILFGGSLVGSFTGANPFPLEEVIIISPLHIALALVLIFSANAARKEKA